MKLGMARVISRRNVLAGLAGAAVAGPVWAEGVVRPRPRPVPEAAVRVRPKPRPSRQAESERLVAGARLGGVTGFMLAEVATGRVIEALDAEAPLPPASVAKAVTALFALEKLGAAHRFGTEVLAAGPVVGDRLEGDLILSGGGDPVLDTDQLGDLVAALAATGIRRVTGRFLAHAGALPQLDRLSGEQPDHVGYNPGLSGLNLNFNRVHFEWRRATGGAAGDWAVSMDARAERFVPPVAMARMRVVPREMPLFTLAVADGREDWTVAGAALGQDGSRWLPVRQPAVYAAEVFQTLARGQGIALPPAEVVGVLPPGARRLVDRFGDPLPEVLRDMLRFSTNLTAESVGLAASGAGSLRGSGAVMSQWAARRLGMDARFVDHSGLEGGSRVTAADMVRGLIAGDRAGVGLRGLLRDFGIRDDKGAVINGHPVQVRAKSGTLNFVSGLSGFILPPGGRELCFAVFSADVPRRAALAMADREQPEGGIGWTRRARNLQGQLIRRWAERYA